MCGIFGYYNYKVCKERRAILEFLITGLRRLEYRGYDSAGLCIDAPLASANGTAHQNGCHGLANSHVPGKAWNGPAPLVIKSVGKVKILLHHFILIYTGGVIHPLCSTQNANHQRKDLYDWNALVTCCKNSSYAACT